MIDPRLPICAAASILGHFLLGEALSTLPPRPPPVFDRTIEIRVVAPPVPPPPEPPKPPEPAPAPETARVHDRPAPRPVRATVHDEIPKTTPVAEHAVVAPEAAARPQPGAAPAGPVAPQAAPVAAYEVTKMPLPQGRCSGKYTEEARGAAVEGTVVLDLIVDEQGRARDIKVTQGLGHGLTQAAIAALGDCRFAPGEKDGRPVPVRVRGFKIRFVMNDAQ
jgi:protein TonB